MYDVIFIGEKIKSPELKSLCIDPDSLLECRGEIGNFQIKYSKNDKIKNETVKSIVINLEANRENPLPETINLNNLPDNNENNEDIIFIQDYEKISPAVINRETLNNAIKTKEKFENNEIYFLYRSMRFIDNNDNLFDKARQLGIIFLKYEMDGIEVIERENQVNYKRGELNLDLKGKIVTAPHLKPSQKIKRIARLLNIEMGDNEYIQSENIYLQPTLTGKRGVYSLAGARGPNAYSDLDLEIDFTLNEIKSNLGGVEPLTDKKREVDEQKCIMCYTCYRVCPHGAVEKDENADAMKINELACYGCDACLSHCPADAISFVEKEEIKESDFSLKVLMCENSADTAFKKLDKEQFQDLDIEKIPCASSIKKDELFSYLRKKDSRLLILGCFEESCKHINGDGRGERISNEVRNTLEELELGKTRVQFERLSPRMEEDLNDFLLRWKEGDQK
ncbi:MAG: hydrogenase iron-sulfur subunit [Halanaerobiales bacterium]|nr:hydrogenase iron-sulfur subunit [Halanaerobiales bacterium]